MSLRSDLSRIFRFLSKSYSISLGGRVSCSGTLIAKKISNDGTDSVRIEAGSSQSVASDLDSTGSTTLSIRGKSPQNEEGALLVCQILIGKMNELGGSWSTPFLNPDFENGIDCIAKNKSGDVLNIQVTRAAPPALWKELSDSGSTNSMGSVTDAVSLLINAIRRKVAKTPQNDRSLSPRLDI